MFGSLAREAFLSLATLAILGHASTVETIERDVIVIGGGGSGAYTAARLFQKGVSVALIEKNHRLGGHVNTYTDPATGATTDYGVVVWANISVVTNFWNHYGEPLIQLPGQIGAGAGAADFKSGTVLPAAATQLDPQAVAGNLTAWIAALQKYPGLISTFDPPYPVPQELLRPFGEYVQKHNLPIVAQFAANFGQGQGNILALPAIYIFKSFDIHQARALLDAPFLVSAKGNTQALYNKVRDELAGNVFLNTRVEKIVRTENCVQVSVTTPSGPKLIKGSKLVVTVPPKLENLGFLDLDQQETALYARFNNSYYWNAIVQNTGLPTNATFNNVDPMAPSGLPALPSVYTIQGTARIPGTFQVYFGSTTPFTIAQVEEQIIATMARLRKGLGLPDPNPPTKVIECNSHNPFHLTVSSQEVANGFYREWLSIQGRRNTWWNGFSMIKAASYPIWNFTEVELLPKLMAK
ncbi:hypothetical protein AC579_8745 [Pseudocercospora musae]|uniref:Amine oxidase domain-containing protein n=1 Tax=Pseudocercospora musae TaxID=113226 RepID=A0A139IWB7_9PEZI|nr:hypothetical protein AC579_8745 [Pseudocercospora musae]